MEQNIPRAAIHVGADKKSFSAQVSNEAERRGWDEKRYQLKNAELEKNNHYNFSRKHLNFEITKGGKIMPLGSNPIPLHERLQKRFDELGFKPYMDGDHPDQVSKNSPNCTVGIIFSGDHEVLNKLAFGNQKIDTSDPNADQSNIKLMQGIYDWAMDTYNFVCRKWGEENVVGFDVHCDETSIHAHVQTVPVEQVKKRGRIGSTYINKDNPDIKLSTKEWKALPKEERAYYTKTESAKDMVERVSYAKVWGDTRAEKSEYLSQLHTDYHNEVGYKYGLERGISYDELTDEEKRARKHKDKVTLEAERQAKAAMTEAMQKKENAEKAIAKVNKYAILATIDKKEIVFPLLNIKQPIQNAKDAVAKELGIPIPAVIGQKSWRENRAANINIAIEALVTAINAERDKQNERVRDVVKKTYTYYMQNLNKLIKANESLSAENSSLKKENAEVKARISQLDEHAVERVTVQKDDVIDRLREQLASNSTEISTWKDNYRTLQAKYNGLVDRWNALWEEPEFNEAYELIKKRRQHEAREAQLIAERRSNILNQFIMEGRQAQREFALSHRNFNFNNSELSRIYYGIVALSANAGISLFNKSGIEAATKKFLDGCDWSGMFQTRIDCCRSWTNILTTKEVSFDDGIIENFASFVDSMSCSQDTYQSLMGCNGCANQLTNWDGTQKRGLGAPTKKRGSHIGH